MFPGAEGDYVYFTDHPRSNIIPYPDDLADQASTEEIARSRPPTPELDSYARVSQPEIMVQRSLPGQHPVYPITNAEVESFVTRHAQGSGNYQVVLAERIELIEVSETVSRLSHLLDRYLGLSVEDPERGQIRYVLMHPDDSRIQGEGVRGYRPIETINLNSSHPQDQAIIDHMSGSGNRNRLALSALLQAEEQSLEPISRALRIFGEAESRLDRGLAGLRSPDTDASTMVERLRTALSEFQQAGENIRQAFRQGEVQAAELRDQARSMPAVSQRAEQMRVALESRRLSFEHEQPGLPRLNGPQFFEEILHKVRFAQEVLTDAQDWQRRLIADWEQARVNGSGSQRSFFQSLTRSFEFLRLSEEFFAKEVGYVQDLVRGVNQAGLVDDLPERALSVQEELNMFRRVRATLSLDHVSLEQLRQIFEEYSRLRPGQVADQGEINTTAFDHALEQVRNLSRELIRDHSARNHLERARVSARTITVMLENAGRGELYFPVGDVLEVHQFTMNSFDSAGETFCSIIIREFLNKGRTITEQTKGILNAYAQRAQRMIYGDWQLDSQATGSASEIEVLINAALAENDGIDIALERFFQEGNNRQIEIVTSFQNGELQGQELLAALEQSLQDVRQSEDIVVADFEERIGRLEQLRTQLGNENTELQERLTLEIDRLGRRLQEFNQLRSTPAEYVEGQSVDLAQWNRHVGSRTQLLHQQIEQLIRHPKFGSNHVKTRLMVNYSRIADLTFVNVMLQRFLRGEFRGNDIARVRSVLLGMCESVTGRSGEINLEPLQNQQAQTSRNNNNGNHRRSRGAIPSRRNKSRRSPAGRRGRNSLAEVNIEERIRGVTERITNIRSGAAAAVLDWRPQLDWSDMNARWGRFVRSLSLSDTQLENVRGNAVPATFGGIASNAAVLFGFLAAGEGLNYAYEQRFNNGQPSGPWTHNGITLGTLLAGGFGMELISRTSAGVAVRSAIGHSAAGTIAGFPAFLPNALFTGMGLQISEQIYGFDPNSTLMRWVNHGLMAIAGSASLVTTVNGVSMASILGTESLPWITRIVVAGRTGGVVGLVIAGGAILSAVQSVVQDFVSHHIGRTLHDRSLNFATSAGLISEHQEANAREYVSRELHDDYSISSGAAHAAEQILGDAVQDAFLAVDVGARQLYGFFEDYLNGEHEQPAVELTDMDAMA